MSSDERLEVGRVIPFPAERIFAVLTDPVGHVDIDATGMLQDADGERVRQVGDSFVVHMDREALGDLPMGRYDVTVTIESYRANREISWSILGTVRPGIGHTYGYRSSRWMPAARWSPRSTTGRPQRTNGERAAFSRWCPKRRCAARSAFWSASYAAANDVAAELAVRALRQYGAASSLNIGKCLTFFLRSGASRTIAVAAMARSAESMPR